MIRRLLLTCFVLLLFPYSSFAEFTGLVVSVLDGDTLEVLHNRYPERIRLSGITALRRAQPTASVLVLPFAAQAEYLGELSANDGEEIL